jgi:hypothetical protein
MNGAAFQATSSGVLVFLIEFRGAASWAAATFPGFVGIGAEASRQMG